MSEEVNGLPCGWEGRARGLPDHPKWQLPWLRVLSIAPRTGDWGSREHAFTSHTSNAGTAAGPAPEPTGFCVLHAAQSQGLSPKREAETRGERGLPAHVLSGGKTWHSPLLCSGLCKLHSELAKLLSQRGLPRRPRVFSLGTQRPASLRNQSVPASRRMRLPSISGPGC